jgi:exopolysaccharide biosynthesis polyprenyl glycosylphosphotransferase
MSSTQLPASEKYRQRKLRQEAALAAREKQAPLRGVAARVQREPRQGDEPFPLILERRAREALRTHVSRAVMRVSTLLAADILLIASVRLVVSRLEYVTWFNGHFASMVSALIPQGTYTFLQLLASIVLGLFILQSYRAGDNRRDSAAVAAGSALGLGLLYWSPIWVSRSPMLIIGYGVACVVLGTALVIERLIVDRLVFKFDRFRFGDRRSRKALRALVISSAHDARAAGHSELLEHSGEFILVGYLDAAGVPAPDALGGLRDLIAVIATERVDTVIIGGQMDAALFEEVVEVADSAGCQVLHLPPWLVATQFDPRMVWRRGIPAISLTRPSLRGQQLVLKRFIDVFVALVAMTLLSPLYALIAAAVKISSSGPVFFKQHRVGLGGQTFSIYKFRTMHQDAEERREQIATQSIYSDRRLFKIKNDPRVTPLGRFLRRTSLDELPQLWNVLCGEMSLVGPRPPIPTEVVLYEEHHYARLCMRPGITGPWQVGGRNNLTDFEEIVRLESAYMRRWTIWKDLEILLRTCLVVLRMEGAH